MAAEHLPPVVIRTFEHYYEQLAAGQTGLIPETGHPAGRDRCPTWNSCRLRWRTTGRAALAKAVLLKLNGGLGTGMGLEKAKSLLTVRTLPEGER